MIKKIDTPSSPNPIPPNTGVDPVVSEKQWARITRNAPTNLRKSKLFWRRSIIISVEELDVRSINNHKYI
jgi:hypothetical protein